MTGPTRVAGWGRGPDGTIVTWTVAEGRKGRRWREVVTRDGGVRHSLLLETDPDRRFSHLELARADGLWTYHPEPDGTLHGNHVAAIEAGVHVRHTTGWPFAADDALIVAGSPISLAALAWHRSQTVAVGGSIALGFVEIGPDDAVARFDTVAPYVERLTETRWRVGDVNVIEIDDAGLPVLEDTRTGPLELD